MSGIEGITQFLLDTSLTVGTSRMEIVTARTEGATQRSSHEPRSTGYVDGGCAKAELSYGKDPVMRRLEGQIIADQHSEIDSMNLWLSKKH